MATFTVTARQDVVNPGDGRLSLREAVDLANATITSDAIDFAAAVDGQRLALTSGELSIAEDLRIDGDGNNDGSEVTLDGGGENRILSIEDGKDVRLEALVLFRGDEGTSLFQGGAGKDTFTGGGARDVFDLDRAGDSAVGARRDVITDSRHLLDDLDLAGIDADPTVAGDQAFTFVGTASLAGGPGRLGYTVSEGDTIIRGSTDADSAAEVEIQLSGVLTPSADDIYL